MRPITLLAILLTFCQSAFAGPKHWYKDPKWWIGEAVIVTVVGLDAYSTSTRPPYLTESNFILGSHPTNQKIAGVAVLNFGIQTSLHAAAWHVTHHVPTTEPGVYVEDQLGWRITGYVAIPTVNAIIGGHAIARNYELR